ncbi:MAG: 3-deoxy-manno-octulosonate cytidylyltransferase [Candidatus Omnitrophica bacterium]|nr:3-deoxy-manno-octulosonate cytidylyltransferase [Candidatus Omnitrophota bacterium]
MRVIGIIPARYNSTRFQGKVLAEIDGKPIVQHVYERAKKAKILDDLIVATDDERVVKVVEAFGGKVAFTSPDQPSGSDRIAEVVNEIDVKIVVNIQGDEPLIEPAMINDVAECMLKDESLVMATIIRRLEEPSDLIDPNIVKVVCDKEGFALYFSRSAIPFIRETGEDASDFNSVPIYKHIGLYAYTKDFLFTFTNFPKTSLEKAEQLEQLRVLENGYRIKTVQTQFDTIGIDTPADLERLKDMWSKKKVEPKVKKEKSKEANPPKVDNPKKEVVSGDEEEASPSADKDSSAQKWSAADKEDLFQTYFHKEDASKADDDEKDHNSETKHNFETKKGSPPEEGNPT